MNRHRKLVFIRCSAWLKCEYFFSSRYFFKVSKKKKETNHPFSFLLYICEGIRFISKIGALAVSRIMNLHRDFIHSSCRGKQTCAACSKVVDISVKDTPYSWSFFRSSYFMGDYHPQQQWPTFCLCWILCLRYGYAIAPHWCNNVVVFRLPKSGVPRLGPTAVGLGTIGSTARASQTYS